MLHMAGAKETEAVLHVSVFVDKGKTVIIDYPVILVAISYSYLFSGFRIEYLEI